MIYRNINIIAALNVLNSFVDKKLPQKISYAITRNIMIFSKEYQCYEAEVKKLETKYQDFFTYSDKKNISRNNQGILILANDQEQTLYNKELFELLNIEIDVPVYCISVDEFNYNDNIGRYDIMTASDIINLQNILCDNTN